MRIAKQKIPAGYEQTELGVIPEDWDVKRLGDIGDTIIGLTYSPNEVVDYGRLVYRSSNIQNNRLSYNDNVYVNKTINEKLILKDKDILICVRNGSRDLIGKSALISGKAIGETFGAFMSVFRTGNCQSFIFYLILSNLIQRQINQSLGATINQITNKTLNDFQIPYPPNEEEQAAIATVLSDTDSLIDSLEKLIAKKKAIKQGTMQELLTGKKRLPGFSGKWEVKPLGEIGKFKGGSGFPIKYQGRIDGKYPFYKVSDMNNDGNQTFMQNSNNWIDESSRKVMGANVFQRHSIVFAKIGAAIYLERKKILSRESCMDNNMMGFIFNENQTDFWFVHFLFMNIQLGKLVSTTALPSLNGKEISELDFAFPKKEEQTAIANILSDMDVEIEQLDQKLDKYKMIKQGMMQALLTGKIRLV